MTNTDIENILKQAEGLRLKVYLCTAGVPTVGWGHADRSMVVGSIYTKEQCERFFEEDFNGAVSDFDDLNLNLDPVRRGVVIMMLFNMGSERVRGFRKFLGALAGKNYHHAAFEMGVNGHGDGPSEYRTDVGNRAHRLMAAMLTGFWV